MMRIAKYLASCGLGARRKCEDFVTNGRVKINNVLINDLSLKVDVGTDHVFLDDKEITPQKKVYYLLNKPVGYTTTISDPHAKKLITELIPNMPPAWPVGRLDKDTSGLIIMTNDGELTQKLTHPKYEKEKEYLATINNPLTTEQFENIKNGITLDDGFIKPDYFKIAGKERYLITIHEGRKRIVRRIFDYFGATVITLERIRISGLELKNLKIGEYRNLTREEIEGLINA